MTWLGVSSVPVETLTCTYNGKMTSISLGAGLKTLNVSHNALTSLDLSSCGSLNTLDCSNNQLTSLKKSGTLYLSKIDCSYNSLTTLEVSNNEALTTLNCSNNPYLTSLNIYYDSKLSNLYLSGCGALKDFKCYYSHLTSLDLYNCTSLETLDCHSQIDKCMTLLDVRGCNSLKTLYCYGNQLSSLNLTGCSALELVDCSNNRLTSLTLPNSCPSLDEIHCSVNNIYGSAMDALVSALPDRRNSSTQGKLYAIYTGTTNTEGNVCTRTQVNIAKAKRWDTYQSDFSNSWLYAGYWDGAPTSIRTAEADMDDDAPRYNLSGQRVGRDYKGVVIVNGKKVVK
jgi:hypothetical protein